MLNPFRSEADAFRLAVATAVVALAALALGLFVGAAAGWAAFGVMLAGALVLLVRRRTARPQPLREAAAAPHVAGPPAHRVLVVANESLAGTLLRRELMRRVELWPELHVVAPAQCSRTHYWASDWDREVREAHARLEATLEWAHRQGFAASGEVAPPDEHPIHAVEEALRRFGADEVVVATHPPERERWFEEGILDRLLDELDVRVTHLVVDFERGRLELEPDEELRIA
jgi:hypothetical protein